MKRALAIEPASRPITIEDLLRQTSGLTYGFYGDSAVRKLYANSDMFEGDFDNAVFADRIAANAAERRHIGWQALPETRNHRPLRPGGSFVIADVISSEVQPKRNCRTRSKSCAIPPHVRMLPGSELTALVEQAGFAIESQTMWDKPREFEEWMGIVNDASRVPPLRAVVRALASAGASAGMGLSEDGGEIRFFHRWNLIAARKPADG